MQDSAGVAQACRDAFPAWVSIPLWLTAEVAIIATDVAEVIGTSFMKSSEGFTRLGPSLAVVLGYELSEVSFVALHCTAMERYTQQVLAIPPIPGVVNGVPQAKGRLEIVDLPGKPDVSVQVQSGQVVVSLRLTDAAVAAQRAAEAAARTWVGRVAFAAGQPVGASEPWVAQALASETRALLRPALVDYWYREGRLVAPARVADILQGKAPEREAFLFWRALRHDVGLSGEQTRVLIAAAQGRDTRKVLAGLAKSEEDWWLVARANLLLTRSPVSLGMRESAEALAEATRFVFDLGAGDVVLTGPQAVRQRDAAGVQKAMAEPSAPARAVRPMRWT